jgi:hypothetical protein
VFSRIRGLFRRPVGRKRAPLGPRPHISDIPPLRLPPANVLEQLRHVDPNAELFYLGLGVWVLGAVYPFNLERYRSSLDLLASERALPAEMQNMARFRLARLYRAGFRAIDLVDDREVETGQVVRDFRYADWRYRNCAEQAFQENLNGSDLDQDFERRKAILLDFNRSECPSIWRHAFKGRRSLLQPGVSWH